MDPELNTDMSGLNRRQQRWLGKYSVRALRGDTAGAQKFLDRLNKAGYDPSGLGQDELYGFARTQLDRYSQQGAVQGKVAKRGLLEIGQDIEQDRVNAWEDAAQANAQDSVARGAQGLADSLSANMGGPVDPNSAAYQQLLARYTAMRQDAAQNAQNSIAQQAMNTRNMIDTNFVSGIANVLDETGSLVEALKQMKEEESRLSAATRGAVFGNPLALFAKAYSGGRVSNDSALGFSSGVKDFASLFASMLGAAKGGGGTYTGGTSGGGVQ